MKIFRHIFVVLLLLFISTTATAQSQSDNTQTKKVSATKADVNGDGVVNEADIEEIIAIIKNNNDTKYYWYVGQTMPDSVDASTWKLSTKDAGFTETVDVLVGDTYLVIPNDWSYTAKDSSGDDFAFNAFVKPADKTKINGYVIYRIVMNGSDKVTITFSK